MHKDLEGVCCVTFPVLSRHLSPETECNNEKSVKIASNPSEFLNSQIEVQRIKTQVTSLGALNLGYGSL